jgi:NAD(P)-dependent dehydrogenase (short-subunit alcohol dehydrogenase family)
VSDLSGRVAVVVGASSGIGLATARQFYDAGATVHAVARRKTELQENDRFHAHTFDLADSAAVERGMAAILKTGPIDVLVYAAGHNIPNRRLAETSLEDWNTVIQVNLNAAFQTLKALLPSLRERHGTAIFISSNSAAWPNLSGTAYQASKTGLFGLTRSAAYEEHQNGVRISVILPGVVDTPFLARRANPPGAEKRVNMLQADDVASACLFLAALPERAYVPEMVLLPTYLQAPGKGDGAHK